MRRLLAALSDHAMCAMMDWRQRRHRLDPNFRDQWGRYVDEHAASSRPDHFHAPAMDGRNGGNTLTWESPRPCAHPENQRCQAHLFPCAQGWSAPTVLMLHALMSASDRGYRQWARRFNERGWNAIFVHLPYHYSRRPRRHWSGELAITADSIRTSEGLRAAVAECRQLMDWVRERGGKEFGLWACSYGGWIGALLASVESAFRFVALVEPIVNVHHAIWESPAGKSVRRGLAGAGVTPPELARHFHLLAPDHAQPACGAERVLFAAGAYDRIARASDIRALSEQWRGSEMLVEPQGHFGYRLMRATWQRLVNGVI